MRHRLPIAVALAAALLASACSTRVATMRVTPGADARGPRVLCVVAHPDDETAFAATLYKISTFLGGTCDIAVLTNGEGGFKYCTLAERLYGKTLTDEAVGRRALPAIRRREMVDAGRILEVRDLHFLNEKDHRYTRDPHEVMAPDADVWDLDFIRRWLDERMRAGKYDFVFTMVPVPETHGHHQAATILALEVVRALPPAERPVIVAARTGEGAPSSTPAGVADFPITRMRHDVGPWIFDRKQHFGFKERLHYGIVVNWVIAAHRSQGTMQLFMNRGEREEFYLFEVNAQDAPARLTRLFDALARPQFKTPTYGPSAGTNAR